MLKGVATSKEILCSAVLAPPHSHPCTPWHHLYTFLQETGLPLCWALGRGCEQDGGWVATSAIWDLCSPSSSLPVSYEGHHVGGTSKDWRPRDLEKLRALEGQDLQACELGTERGDTAQSSPHRCSLGTHTLGLCTLVTEGTQVLPRVS